MIADKLKQRYKESLCLWRYGIEEYNEIQSKVALTDQRLKKLKAHSGGNYREKLCDISRAFD